MVRWPGKIKPGRSPTRSSATTTGCRRFWPMAGDTEVKDKLLKGYKVGDMTYKVHLDGYNLVPYLTGKPRRARGSRSSTSTTTSN